MKKLSIASDHAGVQLKETVKNIVKTLGWECHDYGPNTADRVDYPDFAKKVAVDVAEKNVKFGILICGSGIGMALTANKFKGVRAASIVDEYSCEMTRKHNDLNLLCLGERVIGEGKAENLVKIFLKTEFEGGRHQERVNKILAVEAENFCK